MRFRIGVHLGDVIEKSDGTIYGDGVNVASRLEGLAEPGGVTVSESVRMTVRGKVSVLFNDLGEQQVKNIAESVRAFRLASPSPSLDSVPAASVSAGLKPVDGTTATKHDSDSLPGIAVLPFATAAEQPEQGYFADGLVDDLIGLLASARGLIVIARSSSTTYKGRTIDARTVGRELGVRYAVEGTLRVVAQRLRLNVQLIDCATNASLWSERFDSPFEDLLNIQDEITGQILNAIRVTVERKEARDSRKLAPNNLWAWQLRAQAADHYSRWNRDDILKSIDLNRRAIAMDPGNSDGFASLGLALWAASLSGWLTSGTAAIKEAQDVATRAINLDETQWKGHVCMGLVLNAMRRHDEALAAAERAYELAPGIFSACAQLGTVLCYAGQYEQALPYFDRALVLSPKDPKIYTVYQPRSIALFGLQRYEQLIANAQRVTRQLPEWVEAHNMLAAGHACLGQMELAAQAIAGALRLDPRLTVQRVMRRHPFRIEADAMRLAAALRDAGLATS